jgi:signal transduction histidine kinase
MSSQPRPAEVPPPTSAPARDATEEIIYAVSHDLRGPLLNFQGFLRRLRRSWQSLADQLEASHLTPEQRQLLRELQQDRIEGSFQILEHNARRMEQLLQALLNLSRAGRDPVFLQWVPADELLHKLSAELRPLLVPKQIFLEVGPLPDLWADADRLVQIFRLGLDNAIKFLSPARPGRLRVGGSTAAAENLCWIEDNGIGLRPQDLDRIFLPFGRVREVDAPGCGVGLATVRKLMRQIGGRAWIESTHQQGTTLFLAFPNPPLAPPVTEPQP